MTIAIWPPELPPYFLVDGFSYGFPEGRVSSQPDAGPPKMRRRSSVAVTPIAGQFIGENNDWLRLLDFYNRDLANGSLPFWIPDRMIDGVPLTTEAGDFLTDESGNILLIDRWWFAMFNSVPTLSAQDSNSYRISFTLNVLPS